MMQRLGPMRPKASGLAQHGGPPGWLEESDPAGFDFVRDVQFISPALTNHATCLLKPDAPFFYPKR